MKKISRRASGSTLKKPANPLEDVRLLAQNGKVDATSPEVAKGLRDLGFNTDDLIQCILRLKNKHCYKSDYHGWISDTYYDYYRAVNLYKKQDVYTHFYVDSKSGILVVDSFKPLYEKP